MFIFLFLLVIFLPKDAQAIDLSTSLEDKQVAKGAADINVLIEKVQNDQSVLLAAQQQLSDEETTMVAAANNNPPLQSAVDYCTANPGNCPGYTPTGG